MVKTHHNRRLRNRARRGQAIFEFVAASLALTLVFVGLLQIASLSWNNVDNLAEARGKVDDRLKGFDIFSGAINDDYILSWNDGDDGLRFTADDSPNSPKGWDTIRPYTDELTSPFEINAGFERFGLDDQNQFKGAIAIDSLVEAAELRQGTASRGIEIEKAFQRLMFSDSTSFYIEDRVFMPALDLQEEPLLDLE